MTNFSHAFITSWKAGGFYDLTDAMKSGRIVTVEYDQFTTAYHVDEAQQGDFIEWVAGMWPGDNDPAQKASEKTAEYLDRLGINVRAL